ncbi:MAG: thioesterase family protein [Telmatospirillum sp.]|nr:thioesterase family protein [Telmatospirillum sp.]
MTPIDAASHPFDDAIALIPDGPDRFSGRTHPAFRNMIGPFGGAIAATLLNGVLSHPDRRGDPLALTVHFAQPVAEGGFSVMSRILRSNRSSQHWQVELGQKDGIAAFASIVTANRRESWGLTQAKAPAAPAPDDLPAFPAVDGFAWTANYDMRFIEGGPGAPASEQDPSRTVMWIGDRPFRPIDALSLSALSDAFFPRIYIRRPALVPIGTVTLTVHFHTDAATLAGLRPGLLLGVAHARHFGQGFFDQSAELWTADGTLLATSHQMVYFKE